MLGLLWPSFVGICVLVVLGGPLSWLVGLRGLWLWSTMPVFGVTVIGMATGIAGWIGIRWSILPAVATMVVIAALIVVVRRFAAVRSVPRNGRAGWAPWTVGVLVISGAVLAIQVSLVIGQPEAISQTFDNVFHLNAIRYVLDTGAASPLQLGQMTSPSGGVPFYPSAWHAYAAIIAELSGAVLPAVINAQTVVISAVIWPLGAVLLSRVLIGASPATTVASGIVAASVPAFPLLPMDYGVLYPFQLALAVLPVALAATACALRVGRRDISMPTWWWCVVIVGTLPGLALAHPGGFVAWLALGAPMVLGGLVRVWRRGGVLRGPLLSVALMIGYGLVGILLLKILRPPLEARLWPTVLDPGAALTRVLSVELYYTAAAWCVAAAVVLGIFWMLRRRRTGWLIAGAMWAVGALLFVVVVASPWGTLRDALTGAWYNNWPRLASVFAVALVPVAALGLGRTAEAVSRRLAQVTHVELGRAARAWLGAGASVVGLTLFLLPAVPSAIAQAQGSFVGGDEAKLLSDDEIALLQRLDDEVPEGAVIAGNPYTGAGLAYAFSDRDVLMRHILVEVSDEVAQINDHLVDATPGSAVCDAVEDLGARYVLDFGDHEVHGGSHPLPGLVGLAASPAVKLVDSQGDARLYEVVACDHE